MSTYWVEALVCVMSDLLARLDGEVVDCFGVGIGAAGRGSLTGNSIAGSLIPNRGIVVKEDANDSEKLERKKRKALMKICTCGEGRLGDANNWACLLEQWKSFYFVYDVEMGLFGCCFE